MNEAKQYFLPAHLVPAGSAEAAGRGPSSGWGLDNWMDGKNCYVWRKKELKVLNNYVRNQ